jgi:hypothetical protein
MNHLILLLLFIVARPFLCLADEGLPTQKIIHYSGCIRDGVNAYASHGLYKRTIDFSPDEQRIVYLWSDASYVSNMDTDFRPYTLTESLDIRVRSTVETNELKVPLDSVDYRPYGRLYYLLDGSVQFAPDSKHVAGLCSRCLVLIDLASKTSRSLTFPNEFFGSFSWRNSNTMCFSTYDRKSLTFWRWQIDDASVARSNLYQTVAFAYTSATERPPHLQGDKWSPNGRFVCFRSVNRSNSWTDEILDLDTGTVRDIPFSLSEQCWKPDSGALLVRQWK